MSRVTEALVLRWEDQDADLLSEGLSLHFKNHDRWLWKDVADEGLRVYNLMFEENAEKHSPLDSLLASVAAAAADGVFGAIAAAIGVARSDLECAVSRWYDDQDRATPAIGLARMPQMLPKKVDPSWEHVVLGRLHHERIVHRFHACTRSATVPTGAFAIAAPAMEVPVDAEPMSAAEPITLAEQSIPAEQITAAKQATAAEEITAELPPVFCAAEAVSPEADVFADALAEQPLAVVTDTAEVLAPQPLAPAVSTVEAAVTEAPAIEAVAAGASSTETPAIEAVAAEAITTEAPAIEDVAPEAITAEASTAMFMADAITMLAPLPIEAQIASAITIEIPAIDAAAIATTPVPKLQITKLDTPEVSDSEAEWTWLQAVG